MDVSPVGWIVVGLAVTTLYFQTNLADPFNSPKMWIILMLASWLAGYLFISWRMLFKVRALKNLSFAILLFIISSVIVSMITDFKYVAIFGETQRRNGLITYFSLALIMLSSSVFIRNFNVKRIYTITFCTGLISFVYGFMQTTGNDFIKWNNPYNSIIGTVGNPNFAAAVMAIMGVIIFASAFITDFKLTYRLTSLSLSFLLLILIYLSDAKQGLLSFVLGCSIFSIILVYSKNKKIGVTAIFTGIIVFVFALMGMLQVGPLEQFLYKPSVSVRGYYWRAGIEMLKNNFFTGVGMDRYGAYFKQFREVGYPLSYGFNITSTNAHNTFIQFFATGGLFLGLSYLFINAYILKRAILALKLLEGNQKLLLAGVFSSWIAFHAQSLVSIDNIGISIWGWVLGGAIVGLSISSTNSENEDRKYFVMNPRIINLSRAMVSGTLGILMILLVAQLYRGENNSLQSRVNFNIQDQGAKDIFKKLEFKTVNTKLVDPTYKLNSAMLLINNGFPTEGLDILKELLKKDPRNQDALNGIAIVSEQLGYEDDAINARSLIIKLDPWNAVNYLALGKIYKTKGDFINSKVMLDKILSFAGADPIAVQAKSELA